MSNAIFPTVRGLTWPITRTDEDSNLYQESASGKSVRLNLFQFPKHHWELSYGDGAGKGYLKDRSYDLMPFATETDFAIIAGFARQRRGGFENFLFRDPEFNAVTGQLIGLGDGITQEFQIGRTSGGFFEALSDALPVAVQINGAPVKPGPDPVAAQQWYCGMENLLLQSTNIVPPTWAGGSVAINPNAVTAPDGSTNGTGLTFSSGGFLSQAVSGIPFQNVQFTSSVWLRIASGAATIVLSIVNQQGSQIGAVVVNLTNTWTRYYITATSGQFDTSVAFRLDGATAAIPIYAWGPQLERWSNPSSYSPTAATFIKPNGNISFAQAPAEGAQITCDADYFWRVRFDQENDTRDFDEWIKDIYAWKSVKLVQDFV